MGDWASDLSSHVAQPLQDAPLTERSAISLSLTLSEIGVDNKPMEQDSGLSSPRPNTVLFAQGGMSPAWFKPPPPSESGDSVRHDLMLVKAMVRSRKEAHQANLREVETLERIESRLQLWLDALQELNGDERAVTGLLVV